MYAAALDGYSTPTCPAASVGLPAVVVTANSAVDKPADWKVTLVLVPPAPVVRLAHDQCAAEDKVIPVGATLGCTRKLMQVVELVVLVEVPRNLSPPLPA
jgi:hypothetical protein